MHMGLVNTHCGITKSESLKSTSAKFPFHCMTLYHPSHGL